MQTSCGVRDHEVDPSLTSSTALPKAGRACGAQYATMQPDQAYVVVPGPPLVVALMAAGHRAPLNVRLD